MNDRYDILQGRDKSQELTEPGDDLQAQKKAVSPLATSPYGLPYDQVPSLPLRVGQRFPGAPTGTIIPLDRNDPRLTEIERGLSYQNVPTRIRFPNSLLLRTSANDEELLVPVRDLNITTSYPDMSVAVNISLYMTLEQLRRFTANWQR